MVSAQEGVLLLEVTVPMALHTVAHTLPAATTALSTGVRAKDHLEDQANQASWKKRNLVDTGATSLEGVACKSNPRQAYHSSDSCTQPWTR